MEKFHKNHPRFCTQYIKKVGVAKQVSIGWCRVLQFEGKNYIYQQLNTQHKPGAVVFIAKRIAMPGKMWEVHQVKLAECFWTYTMFCNKTNKEQRKVPYEPRAHTWWSGNTFIVEEASIEYIKRHFGY